VTTASSAPNGRPEGPNILLIMADQLAPHFTGTYGHPLVQTPHMDALAERGIRFDAAYVNSPLCAPARFSMLTGQAITKIGAYDNASEFPSQVPTLAHYLRLMGYRTCLSGKMHFVGPDQLHGFEERVTTDIYPADYARDNAARAVSGDNVQPFFMCASFIHPHDPYVARPEWWNLYDHDDIDMPRPVNLDDLDPHAARIRAGIDADAVEHTDEHVRNSRHGYYANTSYFDSWVGGLVATLEETEQLENTVVMVMSDHGDMLGERGNWFKMSFYERSARIPLIMAGPGVVQGTASNVCSHLDILPTLLDIASDGGEQPELGADIDGRSLWELATGGTDDVDETTGEYTAEMTSHPMFMIRRGAHKYIHCDTDPPLLYNLADDPEEEVNLVHDPDHFLMAADFDTEVGERWDSKTIRSDVLESQRARRTLNAAMTTGSLTSWDFQPDRDAANEYVRNHMDWFDAGPRTRFPRL
jgi:choline-sulfatase